MGVLKWAQPLQSRPSWSFLQTSKFEWFWSKWENDLMASSYYYPARIGNLEIITVQGFPQDFFERGDFTGRGQNFQKCMKMKEFGRGFALLGWGTAFQMVGDGKIWEGIPHPPVMLGKPCSMQSVSQHSSHLGNIS